MTDIAEKSCDTARRVKDNVRNLPLTSMAMAGIVGAATVMLLTSLQSLQRNQ